MKILYFATLRAVTGKREEVWHEPAATLGDLLRALAKRYGAEFERWLLQGDDMSDLAIVLVNGVDVRRHGRAQTPLSPLDTVSLIPPVAGG